MLYLLCCNVSMTKTKAGSLTATSRFNIINEVEKNIKVRPDTVR